MSTEPIPTTPEIDTATDRGLLIAMLLLVLLGAGAMLFMV